MYLGEWVAIFAGIMEADLEGATPVRLVSDPVYGEVDLTATATELACLASAVADGAGFISTASASPHDDNTLAGIEVGKALGSGVRIELDTQGDVAAVTELYQLIGEFFTTREQPDGLARIFRTYQSWAITQDWYHLEDPAKLPGSREDLRPD